MDKFHLNAADDLTSTIVWIIQQKGYALLVAEGDEPREPDRWIAENDASVFDAGSALALLGLICVGDPRAAAGA